MREKLTIKVISSITSVILLLILLWWILPDKDDGRTVVKQTKEQLNETKSVFEDKPNEKDIPIASPISDIPTIKLQPDRQPAEQSYQQQRKIDKDTDGYNQEPQQLDKISYPKPESNNSQSKEVERIGSQSLIQWILEQDEGMNADNPCAGVKNCLK